MTTQTLIDLRTFSKQDSFPAYAAVYCPEVLKNEDVFCLTSQVMQWSEHIWIFDLRRCENFWRLQQQKYQIELFDLLQKVLTRALGKKVLSVFALHPWPAIFFLDYLSLQQPEIRWGAYSLESGMSKKLYENISWSHWFAPLSVLAEKLESLKVKGFVASRFRSQQAQLQRFIERMELWGPYDLNLVKLGSLTGEIERRYSVWLARVWHWTFERFQQGFDKALPNHANDGRNHSAPLTQNTAKNMDNGEDYFPWLAFEPKELPSVKRLLEYPVSQWEVLEPLLQEDLARLCQLSCWSASQERVQRIDWMITLFNFKEIKAELSFRNPYHLYAERPQFKTALYQAYYSYMDVIKALQQREDDLDLPANMPFLSWRLQIKERLLLTPVLMELFPDKDNWDSQSDYELLELQNKLPQSIEAYQIHPDFSSDQLFARHCVGEPEAPPYAFPLQQWKVPLQRPLFYYQHPQVFDLQQVVNPLSLSESAPQYYSSGLQQSDSVHGCSVQTSNKGYVQAPNGSCTQSPHGCCTQSPHGCCTQSPNGFYRKISRQQLLFVERTANNWWESEELDNLVKDYFIFKAPEGVTWWIYKNSRGEWFKHGIFS